MKRRTKVIHVHLSKEAAVTSVSDVKDLITEFTGKKGAYVTVEHVEYDAKVEDNLVKPKGKYIGNGCYRSIRHAAAK